MPAVNNMLGPAPAEIKADTPDQSASLHRESNIRSEVSKLDCLQGPLPRNEIHMGVEVAREVGKGTRDQDKVFAIKREFLDESRARVTGIKILCTLFEVTPNEICTRLNRDLQTSQGFVLEKTHAIVQRVVRESFSIDAATCIDNHIRAGMIP